MIDYIYISLFAWFFVLCLVFIFNSFAQKIKTNSKGEGNFDVRITQSTNKIAEGTGYRVQLRFRITQHERDIKLMENIVLKLGSGSIYKYPKTPAVCITLVSFSDITEKIIPFFNKYTIKGVKLYDYLDWCKIHSLMKDNTHLTSEGLNIIRDIKSKMNKGRNFNVND